MSCDKARITSERGSMLRRLSLASLLLIVGCAGPSLEVGGEKWRGRSNFAADLGKVGEKEGGIGYTFSPFRTIDFGKGFDATKSIRTYMKQSVDKEWKVAVAGSDPANAVAAGEVKFAGGLKQTGEFTIINLDWGDVRTALADPVNAEIVKQMKYDGDRSRVVVGVALTKNFNQVKQATVQGKGSIVLEGVKVGVEGSNKEVVDTSLSDGSVFAYRFMRPVWRKTGQEYELVRLVRDDFGFDKPLDKGETFNPR